MTAVVRSEATSSAVRRSCAKQAEEGGAWPVGARFELGVVLHTNVVRMVLEFKDLATLTRFVLPYEDQSGGFDGLDEVRVDFVAMAVALVHGLSIAVQPAYGAVLDLPDGRAAAQAHRSTEVCFGDFRHEHHGGVFWVFCKLGGVGAFEPQHVSAKFDGGDLQPEADAKVGHVLCSCVMGGQNFSFDTAVAESTRHQDTVRLLQP